MFGGLFIPIFSFLVYLWNKEKTNWRTGFGLALGFTLLLWIFSIILGLVAANTNIVQEFIDAQGLDSTWAVLQAATLRRLAFGTSLLTLVLLIGGAASYLTVTRAQAQENEGDETEKAETPRSPIPFALLLILFGGLLVLAPEFVYLRDQFGNRMNTIFKFYYEAWALWTIAATFGIVVMLSEMRNRLGATSYAFVVTILVAMGLIYPVLGFSNKTNDFQAADPQQRTLDGAAYLKRYSPDQYAAIQFLEEAPPGTLVEAVGDSYWDSFNLAATYSGKPTVLGWRSHESQWRGGEKEKGTRQEDVMTLYTTHDWSQTQEILNQYGIRYVYIGPRERETYPVYEEKFSQHLSVIYNQGDVVIYVVP